MSTDTELILNPAITPAAIAYAVAKAVGVEPPTVAGEPNIFMADCYLRQPMSRPTPDYVIIDVMVTGEECRYPRSFNLHLSNDCGPFNVVWVLQARSTPDNIAVLRCVGEALGGFHIWRESDGKGQMFCGPEEQTFMAYHDAVVDMEKAVTAPLDAERAAYALD